MVRWQYPAALVYTDDYRFIITSMASATEAFAYSSEIAWVST